MIKLGKSRTNQPVEMVDEELYDVVVDTVNDAIEEGDISAGGTQLYKHHLSFSFNADEEPYQGHLDLIAVTNTSMVDELIIDDTVSNILIQTNVDENVYILNPQLILTYGFTEDILIDFIANKFEFDSVSITNITDTTTPV